MHKLLQNQNVLITGAGANIGRGIALEMAAQGAAIYLVEIDRERCEALEQELRAAGATAQGWVVDISSPSEIDELARSLRDGGIRIDILVNNVGLDYTDQRPEQDITDWRRVFDTNVIGPMYLTRLVSQTMVETASRGNIVFITSIHQSIVRGDAMYSGSKAALGMMIEELAVGLAPHGIRVNGIAPGCVRLAENGQPIEHPITPLHAASIHPCYIGRAAVYLASDYFSHCTTGTILKIDAGLSLVNYLSHLSFSPPPPPPPSLAQRFSGWVQRLGRTLGAVRE